MSASSCTTPTETGVPSPHACWNEIGVYGGGSCPELKAHIHCRNCPVYSQAGLRLLDRPLPANYQREWTEHFLQKKKDALAVKTSVVIFRLGAEWLALPTHAFQEVAEQRLIHSLPHRRRELVLGLVNIRGELLVSLSLARLLEIAPAIGPAGRKFNRLLVSAWQGSRFVFPVDEVHGVYRFESGELKEPPATVSRSKACYSRGLFTWKERIVGLLDAELLFSAAGRSLA
jgi:chemotaxis-related protein WspD